MVNRLRLQRAAGCIVHYIDRFVLRNGVACCGKHDDRGAGGGGRGEGRGNGRTRVWGCLICNMCDMYTYEEMVDTTSTKTKAATAWATSMETLALRLMSYLSALNYSSGGEVEALEKASVSCMSSLHFDRAAEQLLARCRRRKALLYLETYIFIPIAARNKRFVSPCPRITDGRPVGRKDGRMDRPTDRLTQ